MTQATGMPSLGLRVANVLGYVALIAVNVCSSMGIIGGTNEDISAKYPTPLTPAGFAFSIWGLIFTLQGLGTIFQMIPHGYSTQQKPGGMKGRVVSAIGTTWLWGWAFQCAWQLCFAMDSIPGMWICAGLLAMALLSFAAGLRALYKLRPEPGVQNLPSSLYLLYFLPTTINVAWLSVATSLGLLIVPVSYNLSDLPAIQDSLKPYAVLLAAVVTLAAASAVLSQRNTAYACTVIWSLVAVYEAHQSSVVGASALVCICLLGLLCILSLARRRPLLAPFGSSATEQEPLVPATATGHADR